MVEVVNMKTGDRFTYINMTTKDAIISAYHQSCGNNNTWEYEDIPHPDIEVGENFMFLGDFAGREYLGRNRCNDSLE